MKLQTLATMIAFFSALGLPFPAQAQSTDAAFIADFNRYALMSPPDVRNALIGDINRRPDLEISSAKAVCEDLQAGATSSQILKLRAGMIAKQPDPSVRRVLAVNVAIVQELAPKYYCPEYY